MKIMPPRCKTLEYDASSIKSSPKFFENIYGDIVDSWIHSLSTYFRTSHDIFDKEKLQIYSL
jgi:hypothetical protein